jgi:hypothetical protein
VAARRPPPISGRSALRKTIGTGPLPLGDERRMGVGSSPPLKTHAADVPQAPERRALLRVLGVPRGCGLGLLGGRKSLTHRRGACASRARGRRRGRIGDVEGPRW